MRWCQVAELIYFMGQYEISLQFCNRAEQMTEKIRFGNTVTRGFAKNLHGRIQEKLGKEEESLRSYEEALLIRRKVFGMRSLTVAHT